VAFAKDGFANDPQYAFAASEFYFTDAESGWLAVQDGNESGRCQVPHFKCYGRAAFADLNHGWEPVVDGPKAVTLGRLIVTKEHGTYVHHGLVSAHAAHQSTVYCELNSVHVWFSYSHSSLITFGLRPP
jgi:hypothetical protein